MYMMVLARSECGRYLRVGAREISGAPYLGFVSDRCVLRSVELRLRLGRPITIADAQQNEAVPINKRESCVCGHQRAGTASRNCRTGLGQQPGHGSGRAADEQDGQPGVVVPQSQCDVQHGGQDAVRWSPVQPYQPAGRGQWFVGRSHSPVHAIHVSYRSSAVRPGLVDCHSCNRIRRVTLDFEFFC